MDRDRDYHNSHGGGGGGGHDGSHRRMVGRSMSKGQTADGYGFFIETNYKSLTVVRTGH